MRNGIMVPLDGSRFAEAALPLAMELARRDGVPLQLVTVWEPVLPLYDPSGWLEQWERERHGERHKYMLEVAKSIEEASGCPVSVEYLKGRPGEVLPPLAELNGLDLVVMSTHARGPIAKATLGSVADHMVRKGTAPVLLVRPDETGSGAAHAYRPRRILVPLDGSELAERALQESMLKGSGEDVEITLLRILAFPLTPAERAVTEVDGQIVRQELAAAKAYLARVAERLTAWNCRVTTRAIEDASPWTGIVDFAEREGIDLIAMTTHGRGGASRLLLGSIANRVIRTSSVPVMLFHPEKAASPWSQLERLAGQVTGMP
jgi:nucleotide-binding universal stress UspA family protein